MNIFRLLPVLCMTIFSSHLMAASDSCYPFTQEQGRISIPITIAGVESRALLNTGMRTIGLSSGLAKQLNLAIEQTPPITPRRGTPIPQPDIVRDVVVSAFAQDLAMEQVYVFEQDAAMVNMSLLMFSGILLQIDYPQSQICFLTRESMQLEDAANINMRTATTGAPAIQVEVNGEKLWLRLQIGLQGALSLDNSAARSIGLFDQNSVSDTAEDADSPLAEGVAESLQFGPFELGNIAVSYSTQRTQKSQRPATVRARGGRRGVETRGELGHEVLKHFVVTLDFAEENMHIYAP